MSDKSYEAFKQILKTQSLDKTKAILKDLELEELNEVIILLLNKVNLFQQEQAMREFNDRMKAEYRLKMEQYNN